MPEALARVHPLSLILLLKTLIDQSNKQYVSPRLVLLLETFWELVSAGYSFFSNDFVGFFGGVSKFWRVFFLGNMENGKIQDMDMKYTKLI